MMTPSPPQTLHQRVSALSAQQKLALARELSLAQPQSLGQQPQAKPQAKPQATTHPASQRLVAYVVAQPNTQVPDSATLRMALKDALPPYMVPAAIVTLSAFPYTANGKIDVRALPEPEVARPSTVETPSTPSSAVEKTLLGIWQSTLGLEAIGIHDNFFEMGGDSILSIQIVSKAREAGLWLAPNQLFEQPTVAELASVVNLAPEVTATQSVVSGPVPLTPIQHWFFNQGMVAPQHWHQGLLLSVPASVEAAQVSEAIATLWHHHDALRLQFTQDNLDSNPASWHQHNADTQAPPQLISVDLSGMSKTGQQQAIADYGTQLHAATNLAKPSLFKAAQFHPGAHQPSWLLISLHHLAVDGISWQILKEDLHTLLSPTTSANGQSAQLPAKTTAYKVWAETLLAQAADRKPELDFWLAQLTLPAVRSPQSLQPKTTAPSPLTASDKQQKSTEATARTHTTTLSAADTSALLQTVPSAYNTLINDALLTALVQTLLQNTTQDTAQNTHDISLSAIRLDLEAHGREQISPEVDTARTVGWFTAVCPIRLALSTTTDIGIALKEIKEQLRQIPDKGIGYGMLRYLSDDSTQRTLAAFPPSEILFNYLGQRDLGQRDADQAIAEVAESTTDNRVQLIEDVDLGVMRSPQNQRSYTLEINAWVSNQQLHFNWTYDTQQLTENVIAKVANTYSNHLKALIQHCLNVQTNSFTPSDFPEVAFTQAELDQLIGQVRSKEEQKKRDQDRFSSRIDAIYPLAPLQQAFLWHALQTSSVSGLLHMRGTLHGDLDAALLQQAWQHVIARHRALRSAVYWQTIQEPVQVAIAQPAIPWQQLDYRAQPNPRQALADFLSRDRALGFDFTQAPITRLALIQLGDREHELVWTCHHLMLDGWSGTFVINQVLATYQRIKHGQPISNGPVTHYQSYIHWLNQQDESATQRFWQATLKGFTTPTPLPLSLSPTLSPAAATPISSPLDLHLSKAQTNTLQTFLRSHRLTLNTLIQGTWALLLSLTSQQPDSLPDVVFGATVSGRQAPLAEVESIVGLLTNVVPVRVQIPPTETALSWLQALQTQQAQASRYAHADPTKIQAWSECHRRLFNSLLVIENYLANTAENIQENNSRDDTSLRLENLRSGIISTYGLTIIVKPGETLALFVEAQGADDKPLMALLSTLKALLNAVVEKPETSLSQIIAYTKAQAKEHLKSLHERPEREDSGQKAASALERNTEEAVGAIASTHDLPKTPLERQLTQIWETVLGHSPLGVETSFFEVGGDSLLAVQLFNQMQQQVQCDLPLATLFQAPTIRQFAALLHQRTVESATHSSTYQSDASQKNTASKWSSLVPVQAGGTRRPLFFHGGSADALTWARFSRLLGPDQPFYALQRPDLDGRHITDIGVEALAEACIKDIKTIQPTGPYLIGGHCFGGAVAFEIARQLQTQGEITSSLIQIDAYCPNAVPNTFTGRLQEQLQIGLFLLRKSYYYHASPQKLLQLPRKIWQRLFPRFQAKSSAKPTSTQISSQSSIQRPTLAQYPQQPQPQQLHPQTPHSQTIGSPVASPQTTHLAYEDRYTLAHQANLSAAEQYRPQHYPPLNNSPLHIFQAKAQILDWRYGPFLGWKTVSDSAMTTTTVPGLFGNLFNQRSGPLLAQQVKAHLDTLQPAQPSQSKSISTHASPPNPAVQTQ